MGENNCLRWNQSLLLGKDRCPNGNVGKVTWCRFLSGEQSHETLSAFLEIGKMQDKTTSNLIRYLP